MTASLKLAPAILALLVSGFVGVAQAADPIAGTWRLVSIADEAVDTKTIVKQFGDNPTGFVTFTPEGRMSLIFARSDRKPPARPPGTDAEAAALLRTMVAFAGTYKIDGKTLIIRVDVSWHQAWNGTDLTRVVELSGDRLEWKTAPFLNPISGQQIVSTTVWERVK